MVSENNGPTTRRIAASGDVEVSTYLEIAEERGGLRPIPENPHKAGDESVVVVDFGSQYSRLIARRVRESRVYCEIVPHDAAWDQVAHLNPKGVILSGGPASVYEPDAPMAPMWIYERRLPILGICYGLQVLAHQLGGKVVPGNRREYGHAVLHQNAADSLIFADLPSSTTVWMSHGDQVLEMPPGFRSLGLHRQLAYSRYGQR